MATHHGPHNPNAFPVTQEGDVYTCNGKQFDCPDEAYEYAEGLQEWYDDDYDRYQEENHHAIAQMEAYENFRNEY
jgi:hypothetical protein